MVLSLCEPSCLFRPVHRQFYVDNSVDEIIRRFLNKINKIKSSKKVFIRIGVLCEPFS